MVIEEKINTCFKIAKSRLKENYDKNRRFYFYIIEHSSKDSKRLWYMDKSTEKCIRET